MNLTTDEANKLIEAGDAMHDHIGRLLDLRLVGDLRTECYVVRDRYIAAKSAAPVDTPKVLTDERAAQIAQDQYVNVFDNGDEEWQMRLANAMAHGLLYARDNDLLAPAKVDVDAVMDVVLDWCCPTRDAEDQLRACLNKLFNA